MRGRGKEIGPRLANSRELFNSVHSVSALCLSVSFISTRSHHSKSHTINTCSSRCGTSFETERISPIDSVSSKDRVWFISCLSARPREGSL